MGVAIGGYLLFVFTWVEKLMEEFSECWLMIFIESIIG